MHIFSNVNLTVRYFLTLLLVFVFSYICQGQILNVEKSRIKEDSANYFIGRLGLSFTINNRDSDENGAKTFIGLTGNGDIAYMSDKHSYMLINYINYTALGDDPAIHTGYSHFRINLFRKATFSNELFTQYQYDLGRGLAARWLIGTGLRITIVKNKKTEFVFGQGIMYEYEKWEVPEEVEDNADYRVARLLKSTNYLSLRESFSEHVDFNTIVYYQTGYDNSIDNFRHRVSGDVNLIISVTDKLALTTNFNCTFENRPIVPVTKFVYSVTNGLQYAF